MSRHSLRTLCSRQYRSEWWDRFFCSFSWFCSFFHLLTYAQFNSFLPIDRIHQGEGSILGRLSVEELDEVLTTGMKWAEKKNLVWSSDRWYKFLHAYATMHHRQIDIFSQIRVSINRSMSAGGKQIDFNRSISQGKCWRGRLLRWGWCEQCFLESQATREVSMRIAWKWKSLCWSSGRHIFHVDAISED
jgi:hypothetical protein